MADVKELSLRTLYIHIIYTYLLTYTDKKCDINTFIAYKSVRFVKIVLILGTIVYLYIF